MAFLPLISARMHCCGASSCTIICTDYSIICKLLSLQPARIGLQPHHVLADRFEMLLPALQLLRDRMDVAEAALERVFLEDRGRAGGLIRVSTTSSDWWIAKVEARRITSAALG